MLKLFTLLVLLFSTKALADEKVVLSKDNTITLNNLFTENSVSVLMQEAKELDSRIPSNQPLYLVLNSGGGSIDAGLALIRHLKDMNREVKTISLFSASMGFQTVQGLGERLITSFGTLMSHKASGGFKGEFPGQLDSRYDYWKRRVKNLNKITVQRTKGKHTLESYEKLIENEYWCDGQECVDQGFADRVVSVNCDATLSGTTDKVLDSTSFLGIKIELMGTMPNCPLNPYATKVSIQVDGKPSGEVTAESLGLTTEEFAKLNKYATRKSINVNKRVIKKSY